MTARQPRCIKRSNGYFEIWALPCGHQVRVTTEHLGLRLRSAEGRQQHRAYTRDRLAGLACADCAKARA
jgi:hypothetical protein